MCLTSVLDRSLTPTHTDTQSTFRTWCTFRFAIISSWDVKNIKRLYLREECKLRYVRKNIVIICLFLIFCFIIHKADCCKFILLSYRTVSCFYFPCWAHGNQLSFITERCDKAEHLCCGQYWSWWSQMCDDWSPVLPIQTLNYNRNIRTVCFMRLKSSFRMELTLCLEIMCVELFCNMLFKI